MWDPSKHPRVPSGSPEGGEFTTEAIAILSLSDADGRRVVHADGTKPSNDEIAAYFDKHNKKLDLDDPDEYAQVLRDLEAELGSQLKQPYPGTDFYDTNVRDAMKIAMEELPSLRDHDNRIVFLAASAMMSNNTPPSQQFNDSLQWWEAYAANGFKTSPQRDSGKAWGLSKDQSLEALTIMVDKYGMKGTVDYLTTTHTIGQLQQERDATKVFSLKTRLSGKDLEVETGFAMFGPKIGQYVRNMNGLSGVTIDLWATRTINRHTATMSDNGGAIKNAPTDRERVAFKGIIRQAGVKYGLTEQESQAGLWFFEQRLYSKLGKTISGNSLVEGATRYRDRKLLGGGPKRGSVLLSVPPKAARMGSRAPKISRPPRGAKA